MSGGVDSSACATIIVKKQNIPAVGVTMKLTPDKTDADFADARLVCEKIGIPHHVIDLCDDFKKYVTDYFINSYLSGDTPNPCVMCNKYLKFGRLFDIADTLGCTHIATGHYARCEYDSSTGKYLLRKAVDHNKDQSYFLYTLRQEQLKRIIFPIGGYQTKDKIREIAGDYALQNAQKPDSQDICFIQNGNYIQYINEQTGIKQPCGNMVLTDGTVIGKHNGLICYTVGQRKGLGVSYQYPLYVCGKDIENNRLILGAEESLYGKRCVVKDFHSDIYDFTKPLKIKAKIRSRHEEQNATARLVESNTLLIEFDEAQKSFTNGQSAVLYDGEYVLGGGVIDNRPQ